MIDINLIRTNPELVKENIKKKFQDHKLEYVDEVIKLDNQIRALKKEGDSLRAERNANSSKIGLLMREKKIDEANAIKGEVVKGILQKYGLTEEYKGRVDFGGSRHDPEKWTTNIPINKQLIITEIQQLLDLKNEHIKDEHITNLQKLTLFLQSYMPSPRVILGTPVLGCMPYIRNVTFSQNGDD